MSDLFKCDAHLRPIDEEAELGPDSSIVARVDVIIYFGNPRGTGEQGKVGISESVGPEGKYEYETRYQCTQ